MTRVDFTSRELGERKENKTLSFFPHSIVGEDAT
jgi:hypothetical protein